MEQRLFLDSVRSPGLGCGVLSMPVIGAELGAQVTP